ncbi:MAG: C39 family peptidase [Acidimicrobiales bacterium]
MSDTTIDTTSTVPDIYDDGSDLSMSIDVDGDGWAETTVFDTDGNGIADLYEAVDPMSGASFVAIDTDGDGMLDTYAEDLDGDGEFESGWYDTDGDGVPDAEFDPSTGASSLPFDTTGDGSCDLDPSDTGDTGDTGDDADDTDDGVHGDPMAEVPYHQAQVGPNDCLPTSVAMVLSEATGVEVPQGDVVDLANQLGLLGPTGMSLEGGVALLDHWGVDADVRTGTIDDLRTLLDQGTPVIIGLDADDLYGQGDQPFADDLTSGHAVVITGIDDEAGVVYVNDPGFPDGAGVAVSISEFEDAWVDSGNSMIVADTDATSVVPDAATEGAATGASEAVTEATTDRGGWDLVDLVLVPLRLVLR